MRVRINGKEVEVGPSKHIKEKFDIPQNSSNYPLKEKKSNYFRLKINGREVDRDDPDDIQKAILFCKTMGGIVLGFGIIFLLVSSYEIDWSDFYFDENILGSVYVISFWLILGTIFFIFTPKALQKRLDELRKQGKVPFKR